MEFRRGSRVPFPAQISEGYCFEELCYTANVGADKLRNLLEQFIRMHAEPLFFILELPTNLTAQKLLAPGVVDGFCRDVYYIDGCTPERALELLDTVGELLIRDGLCTFGFSCHRSRDEILVGKYNVVSVYGPSGTDYGRLFAQFHIPAVENLITAWDTFTEAHPGDSQLVVTDGRRIYDLPELLQDWGIYFAERRNQE